MKKEIGETRIVFVFDRFVVKIARIRPVKAVKKILSFGTEYLSVGSSVFLEYLIGGLIGNIFEQVSYLSLHKILRSRLSPTCFCFFGFINIAKKVSEIPRSYNLDQAILRSHIYSFIKYYKIPGKLFDTHTFVKLENYGFYKNKLVLLDYGNPWMYELFHKFPNEMKLFFQVLEEILKKRRKR